MDKISVEKYVLDNYPVYIDRLRKIEAGLMSGLEWYKENYPKLFSQNDFRPGTLGRFLSCTTTSRFAFDRFIEYVKRDDWPQNYLENYSPSINKGEEYFGGFKDLDTMQRFSLFHSVYHQLETTARIVHRELGLKKGKPMTKINQKLKVFPKDFLDCFEALRNTIHNNGFYKPIDKQADIVEYKTEYLNLKFEKDHKVPVTTNETIILLVDAMTYSEDLLKHPEIVSLDFVPDHG